MGLKEGKMSFGEILLDGILKVRIVLIYIIHITFIFILNLYSYIHIYRLRFILHN